jgi:hypothetical protein
VVRSRRTSSGAGLFRSRTHANDGMRTVERMIPGLAEAARPLSAARWLRGTCGYSPRASQRMHLPEILTKPPQMLRQHGRRSWGLPAPKR